MLNRPGTKTIETERTMLRNFRPFDIQDLYEYCSMDGVGEMAGWPKHTSIDYSIRVLKSYIKNKNMYAVVYKENNKVIGHIIIQDDSEYGRADTKELGYVLNRNYWNKGIMTEVVRSVIKELFENCRGISCLYARCSADNLQSKRLLEKCGFKFEQKGKHESRIINRTFESYKYLYSKDEYNLHL